MRRIALILLAAQFLQLAARAGEDADGILGVWRTADDKSQVQIYREKDQYFGKILSLKDPNWPADDGEGMGGKPKNDRRNPDPKLRNRQIVGIQFMTGFSYAGKNVWESGRVYDPESGKTYRGKMYLTATNQLELRGYVGLPIFGRTEVWRRAAPP